MEETDDRGEKIFASIKAIGLMDARLP